MKNSNNSSLLDKTLVKSTCSFYYMKDGKRESSFNSVAVSIKHDDRNKKVWLIVRADERTERTHWIEVTVVRNGSELRQSRLYKNDESFAKAIKNIEKKVNSNKF